MEQTIVKKISWRKSIAQWFCECVFCINVKAILIDPDSKKENGEFDIKLTKRNIIYQDKNPHGGGSKFFHYSLETCLDYAISTNWRFNTRIDYPLEKPIKETNYLWCYFTIWQRIKYRIIMGETFFHKNPIPFFMLIIAFANAVRDFWIWLLPTI